MVSVQCTLVRQAKRSANRRRSEEDAIVNARIYPRAAFTHSSVVGSREQRDATRRDRDAKDRSRFAVSTAPRSASVCPFLSGTLFPRPAFVCICLHSPAFASIRTRHAFYLRTHPNELSRAEPFSSASVFSAPHRRVVSARFSVPGGNVNSTANKRPCARHRRSISKMRGTFLRSRCPVSLLLFRINLRAGDERATTPILFPTSMGQDGIPSFHCSTV